MGKTEKSATPAELEKYIKDMGIWAISTPYEEGDLFTFQPQTDPVLEQIYTSWKGVYGSSEKVKPKPPHCKWCVCEECDPRV